MTVMNLRVHLKTVTMLAALAGFFVGGLALAATPSDWKAPAESKGYKNPKKNTKASQAAGKKVYVTYCALCHGSRGKGDGPSSEALLIKPANFGDKKRMKAQSDGELAWKTLSGRGPMPSWAPVLKEDEVWHVINYIRTLAK